ncbi:MAG: sigma-70 family RNA polymerase sigma factor [Chloroflexota bacterium]
MNDPPTDQALIESIQGMQAWAFEALFERYESPLHRHLCHIVGDEPAAEDLLQETFLRVWRRAGQWSGQGAVKAWLFRIATNLALNHLRTRRRRPEQPLDLPDYCADVEDDLPDTPAWLVDSASLGPEAVVEQVEQAARLRQILRGLPEDKRELLHLVHQMEFSLREAADELGIPEGTAKSRLHYAREQVKHGLQAEQE